VRRPRRSAARRPARHGDADGRAARASEPTRGVDVGAKAELHRLVREAARDGMAVMMISSELPEVLGVSDRILVLHQGRVAGELAAEGATEEEVVALAFGPREAQPA
jgi:ribose transport system ATP-binding protein